MANQLATRAPVALTPQSVAEAEQMAETLSKSKLVPEAFRGKPADCFLAISYGLELGMSPVSALMSINVINGKPSLYAHAMVGLVLASGKAKYFSCVEADDKRAIYETHRTGARAAQRKEFTIEQAKAAGLNGPNWKKYPQQMLEARAKAFLARDVYADVVSGIMSAEEAAEIDDAPPGVDVAEFSAPESGVIEAEIVDDGAPTALDLIADTQSIDELKALIPQLKKLSGDERIEALAAYSGQETILAKAAR